jgi:tagatose 6-phosphate kinase
MNRDELEKTLGRRCRTVSALVAGLRHFLAYGACLAVVTLGAEGALALTPESGWRLLPPTISARSTAGSGDAFAAAMLVWREKGAEWPDVLRWAAATGTAKALEARSDRLDATKVRSFYRRVQVKRL